MTQQQIAAPFALPRLHGGGRISQLRALTRRSMRTLIADPRVAVLGMVHPLLLLFVFSEVFGSMADPADFPSDMDYVEYLVPALLITSGIGSAQTAGMALVRELANGMITRFRAMPVKMPLVLTARGLADLTRTTTQLVLVQLCALLFLGYSPAGGLLGSLVAMLVAVLVIWAMIWVFLALGAWLRSPEIMQTIGLLTMFPLMFASSAFVPLTVLPSWLQAVAVLNPLTYAIDASRSLVIGTPHFSAVSYAVVSSIAIALVGAFLAAKAMRRPVTH